MWRLWRTAQETHSRPSDLLCIEDRLMAFLFDSCVVTFGTIIENARAERVRVGDPKKFDWEQKYTMDQLLDQNFFLPSSNSAEARPLQAAPTTGIAGILALADEGNNSIKRWVYVGPEAKKPE
jgi:hypothetical protein